MYAYTEEHDELEEQKSLLHPFFLGKQYTGRKTEKAFAKYLDSQDTIEWWFKNGDSGKDWLAIRYFNEDRQEEALFYPDWVFRKTDGTIGIFDTKGGQTASSRETKNKAEALQRRIALLNENSLNCYVGGIVIEANGTWYYNAHAEYSYRSGSTDGWNRMQDLFDDFKIQSSVPASDRFVHYLPLYSVRAACGYFEISEQPEAEGWVDVSSLPFKPNEDMLLCMLRVTLCSLKLKMVISVCSSVIRVALVREKSYFLRLTSISMNMVASTLSRNIIAKNGERGGCGGSLEDRVATTQHQGFPIHRDS